MTAPLFCPTCQKRVYEDEKTCPNCAAKNPHYDAELVAYEQEMDAQRERQSAQN